MPDVKANVVYDNCKMDARTMDLHGLRCLT